MAKILIVDDEPLITAMLEDWLSELGHDVVGPAHNLAKALELAESEIDAAIHAKMWSPKYLPYRRTRARHNDRP